MGSMSHHATKTTGHGGRAAAAPQGGGTAAAKGWRLPARRAVAAVLAAAATALAAFVGLAFAIVDVAAVVPAVCTTVGLTFGDTSRMSRDGQWALYYLPSATAAVIATYLVWLLARSCMRLWARAILALLRLAGLPERPRRAFMSPPERRSAHPALAWLGWLALRLAVLVGVPVLAVAAVYLVGVDAMPLVGDAVHLLIRVPANLTGQGLWAYRLLPMAAAAAILLGCLYALSRAVGALAAPCLRAAGEGMRLNRARAAGRDPRKDAK